MNEKRPDMDATFCGKIPLHHINSIQPQGVLIVVNLEDLTIVQASENIEVLFGGNVKAWINRSIVDLLSSNSVEALEKNKNNFQSALPVELLAQTVEGDKKLFSLVHEKNGCLMIEIELPSYTRQSESNFNFFFQQVQHIMSSINSCNSVAAVAEVAAKQIRQLTGFDKVMIYSFDEEWIGTVIGEDMEEGMDSYLGLRFPASDIPKQARDLYLKNPYRLIPNINYVSVGLVPELNPVTNAPTDLSDCKFRSVVKVHLEYLRNMNIITSMSTRLIHKERLWGLIACHHKTPKYLSFQECSFFEFLSNIISSKIASLLYRQTSSKETKLLAQYNGIITNIQSAANVAEGLNGIKDDLLVLLEADGIAVCWDNKVYPFGTTPSKHQVQQLQKWLMQQQSFKTIQYYDLPLQYEPAKEFADTGSGLLVLPVQPYEGNYILAFRTEVVKKVSWGGDPNNVVTFEPNSTKYHPRNSFSIWRETVKYTSEPWEKEVLDIAEKLRIAIVEYTLRRLTATLEQEVFKRTEELYYSKSQLESTYNELMQILYVTSHDLNEPVRKIQVYGNMLSENITDETGKEYLERLVASAKRIATLTRSLLNYSRLSQSNEKVSTDLNVVVSEVLEDLEMIVAEKKAVLQVGQLPKVAAVQDQMRQVFHSIIDNSLKFSKQGVKIEISSERIIGEQRNDDYYRICIRDTGIGFNNEYADYIFEMFKKFHTAEEFEGAGIGLTIAKKIIENHNGTLTATGKENKGAEFIITLPVD